MLDRRGLYQRLTGHTEIPQPAPGFFFGALPLDLGHTRGQSSTDCLCRSCTFSKSWASVLLELGVEVRRGHESTGLLQRADEVIIDIDSPDGKLAPVCAAATSSGPTAATARPPVGGIGFPGARSQRRGRPASSRSRRPPTWSTATGGLNAPGDGHIPPFIYQWTEDDLRLRETYRHVIR